MRFCKTCGSYAINPGKHGRDDMDLDLCDVCYWRKRAEVPALPKWWIYNCIGQKGGKWEGSAVRGKLRYVNTSANTLLSLLQELARKAREAV